MGLARNRSIVARDDMDHAASQPARLAKGTRIAAESLRPHFPLLRMRLPQARMRLPQAKPQVVSCLLPSTAMRAACANAGGTTTRVSRSRIDARCEARKISQTRTGGEGFDSRHFCKILAISLFRLKPLSELVLDEPPLSLYSAKISVAYYG